MLSKDFETFCSPELDSENNETPTEEEEKILSLVPETCSAEGMAGIDS